MTATAATLTKLLAWRPGGYLRASGALFAWLAVRTAAQTVPLAKHLRAGAGKQQKAGLRT